MAIEDAGGFSAAASLAVTLSMPMGSTLVRFFPEFRTRQVKRQERCIAATPFLDPDQFRTSGSLTSSRVQG